MQELEYFLQNEIKQKISFLVCCKLDHCDPNIYCFHILAVRKMAAHLSQITTKTEQNRADLPMITHTTTCFYLRSLAALLEDLFSTTDQVQQSHGQPRPGPKHPAR